jgi:predicted acetyltransferase
LPVSIRDANSSAQDREWIQSAFHEYLDELTQVSMNTGMFPVLGEFGDRQPDMLARWFSDDSSHPLVILKEDAPVGFALVSRPPLNLRHQLDFRMAEFYVRKNARRRGIGQDAACLIFRRFAGRWEVLEYQRNQGAVAFWRSVVSEFAQGRYRESAVNGEVRQLFTSGKPAGSPRP